MRLWFRIRRAVGLPRLCICGSPATCGYTYSYNWGIAYHYFCAACAAPMKAEPEEVDEEGIPLTEGQWFDL